MAATLVIRLTGGSVNANPNASLGGTMSSTAVTSTVLNNLYNNVSPSYALSGVTDYRAVDLYNSGNATAASVCIYINSNTTSTRTTLALGQNAANNPHSSASSLEQISSSLTTPSSVTFGNYTPSNMLVLSDIPSSQCARIWLRRTVSATCSNLALDQAQITAQWA